MHIARTNILKEKQKKVKTRSMHTISICTDPIWPSYISFYKRKVTYYIKL